MRHETILCQRSINVVKCSCWKDSPSIHHPSNKKLTFWRFGSRKFFLISAKLRENRCQIGKFGYLSSNNPSNFTLIAGTEPPNWNRTSKQTVFARFRLLQEKILVFNQYWIWLLAVIFQDLICLILND